MPKSLNNTAANGITQGVIWKQLLLFFFPILFGSLFQQLYSTTDAIVLGQFVGKQALAAIDSTGSMVRILVSLFMGLSSGATILISQHYGAGRYDEVSHTVHNAVALSALGGAIVMVAGLLLADTGVRLVQVPADIFADAVTYVRIYFIGIIPSMLYNMGAGILRAVGDSRRPLYFLIIGCVLNIGLDLLFVAVLRLGVAGAAVATVLSQAASAVMVLVALARSKGPHRLVFGKIRMQGRVMRNIVRVGLPVGLQSAMYPIANMVTQANVNRLGTDIIAAWAVNGKLDMPVWLIMDALAISVSTFVAQNYGAGKPDRVKKSVRTCILFALAAVVPISLVLTLFGGPLSRIFVQDEAVNSLCAHLMRLYAPFLFTFVFGEAYAGAIRGTGETLRPMLLTMAGTCLLRIAWALLVFPLWPTAETAIFTYPLTWVVTSLAYIIYYSRYRRRLGI